MSEAWQPIETSPKDGSSVLGYFPANDPGLFGVYFCERIQQTYWDNVGWTHPGAGPQPTHWMPLPDRPKVNT